MIRRIALAALTCALLSGCAAGAGLFRPATGTVSGHVLTRACGGAYRENQPACRSTPLAGARLTFANPARSSSVTVQTDARGGYSVSLTPGKYDVNVIAPAPASAATAGTSAGLPGRRLTGPAIVTVTAGKTTTADYSVTILLL
jgi:Carboxypeptidase regulatory-like domain